MPGKRLFRTGVCIAGILGLLLAASPGSLRTTSTRLGLDPVLRQLATLSPREIVQVIVQKRGSGNAEAVVERLGGHVLRPLSIINGFTAQLPARTVPVLAADSGVRFVSFDRPLLPTAQSGGIDDANLLTSYPVSVSVADQWDGRHPVTGAGVTVAVLDSGVSNSIDFGNRLLAQVVLNGAAGSEDSYGHGTHVAGIIAGNDPQGRYIGVAPLANILSVKMSDDGGNAAESDAIQAIEWVYTNAATWNIKVVNISATAGVSLSYHDDPLDAAVEKLWFAGITVVVAAGNRGGARCSVCYAPANDPFVITVGSIDDHGTKSLSDDTLPEWTPSGKTQDGFRKPDVLAPGSRIISLLASPNVTLAQQHPQNVVDTSYFVMGGTSMSAPMVSGVAALMLEANPALTPDQIKYAIVNNTGTYRGQLSNTPGIINGAAAINYVRGSDKLPRANRKQEPSASLDTGSGVVSYSNVYWANIYWANIYWANDATL